MKKLIFYALAALVVSGGAVLVQFTDKEAHQPKNLTIGLVNLNPGTKAIQQAFVNELQKYSQEENWDLTFHTCNTKKSFEADLKKLVSHDPDLIFSLTTPATKKVQKAFTGTDTPGVFVLFDPVKAGIINSLSLPGGKYTGIQLRGSAPKALEWLLTVSPEIKHILVPIKFDTKSARMSLGDLKKAAKSLGVKLQVAEVNSKKELDTLLEAIPEKMDAIFLLNSIFISTHAESIALAAINKKLPTAASIYKNKEGVLLTYSTQHRRSGRQAARLAHEILKGQSPAQTPSEISDFYLNINLATAKQINLEIKDDILAQADRIQR